MVIAKETSSLPFASRLEATARTSNGKWFLFIRTVTRAIPAKRTAVITKAIFTPRFIRPTVRVLNVVAFLAETVALPGGAVERKAGRFREPATRVKTLLD